MSETEYSIAIVGMAGRFPCADDINTFWENIKAGKDCITRNKKIDTPDFMGAYGRLDHIDEFDADFFKVTQTEAMDSDPEQRIMMELTYHALENAGCANTKYEGKIGTYISFDNGIYVWNYIMQDAENWYERYELYKTYLATRCEKIAYKFGFEGPAIMSEYACASSLNAIHQACQSLLNYECDMALAGGITAEPEQNGYQSYLATESSKGQIRPFDADADGLVPGSAAGLVVLKRYEDACNDHDNIVAVIKGTFINNDGDRKAGFAAPSVFGQKECLESVLAVSDVEPDEIDYYEAHGTATELGDGIELRAIKSVVGNRPENRKLYIGSLKSNIGHTNMAAGVSNVIKTALILKNRTLVPSIHYEHPCDELKDPDCAIKVSTELKEWKEDKQMMAVCSAVGMGGANAMAVLGEFYGTRDREEEKDTESQLFLFSGKTSDAVKKIADAVHDYVLNTKERYDDIAYTLQSGRNEFEYRTFSVANKSRKNKFSKRRVHYVNPEEKREIVFVFSGVGSFDRTIGKELYLSNAVFRKYMDACFESCEKVGVSGAKKAFLDFIPRREQKQVIENEQGIQILFSLGYSMAKTLIEFGIKPERVIGHSNGEYIAAAVSGIFSVEDAIDLLIKRTRLAEQLPESGMINVAVAHEEVEKLLIDGVVIGAVNAPNRTMAAGTRKELNQFEEILKEHDMMYSRMAVSRASHCYTMLPIVGEYRKILNQISFHAPSIPIVSCCDTDLQNDSKKMQSPEYWLKQLCEPINFYEAVKAIDDQKVSLFIELGTGDALTAMIRKMKNGKEAIPAFAIFDSPTSTNSRDGFLGFLGDLWCNGLSINWEKLYEEKPYKVSLTNYPFEHKKYWKYKPLLNIGANQDPHQQEEKNIVIVDGLREENYLRTQYAVESTYGRTIIVENEVEQYHPNSAIKNLFQNIDTICENLQNRFFDDQDITLLKDIPHYEEDANYLVAACIMDYFRQNPAFDVDGTYTLEKLIYIMKVTEEYIPFIDYFVCFLTDYEYIENQFGIIRFLEKAKKIPSKQVVLEDCKKKHPDCYAYMEFCVYASDYYDEVFRGKRRGSSVIYHDGKFDFINEFEAKMPKYSYAKRCIESLADVIAEAAKLSERKIRILEIGGGSGELTDILIDKLQNIDFEYWFTDIKKSLVLEREQTDQEKDRNYMRYSALDISKNPKEQGFPENAFDIVLLYDVIQATTCIENTLKNISALLAENGMFSFVQTCDGSELLNMIFGYAPGWWNYYNDPMRKRITMPPEDWREILIKSGFQDVHTVPEDGKSNSYLILMRNQEQLRKEERVLCSIEKNQNYLRLKENQAELVFTQYGNAEEIKEIAERYNAKVIWENGETEDSQKTDSRNRTDQLVLRIVKEVLGYEVSIEDNLYELGMDSLMAMMISSKVQTEAGLQLKLSDMYEMSTVKEISDFLAAAEKKEVPAAEQEVNFIKPDKDIDDLFRDL